MWTKLGLLLALGTLVHAQQGSLKMKEPLMSRRATGSFAVKATPLPGVEKTDHLTFPRLALDKQFQGDLEGTSQGEMMTVETATKGSAGYVAIERVNGSLSGRKGTFVLLHKGTMRRGAEYSIAINVVPDSGTDQLIGLAGTMEINISEGKHFYNFDYSLP